VNVVGGTLTIFGCNLVLSGGILTGILQDGTLINTPASVTPPGQLVLQNSSTGAPRLTCPANVTVLATNLAGAVVTFPPPLVTNTCGSVTVTCTAPIGTGGATMPAPSGSTFPVGTTPVTCAATDPLGNTGSCQFLVTVLPSADLTIGMAASPTTVKRGQNVIYTIAATNAGPLPAGGVVVTDNLPPDVGFVSTTAPSGSYTAPPAGGSGPLTVQVGRLGVGATTTFQVVVTVTARAKTTVTNTASVSASNPDPNTGNNTASVTVAVFGSHK
jgi:uncharacterized repeat protein (TIGR01451 family)